MKERIAGIDSCPKTGKRIDYYDDECAKCRDYHGKPQGAVRCSAADRKTFEKGE